MVIIKVSRKSDGKEVVQCIKLTEDEFRSNDSDYNGICLSCGKTAIGSTEPDAREYECEYCDEKAVYGFQELLIMNRLKLV